MLISLFHWFIVLVSTVNRKLKATRRKMINNIGVQSGYYYACTYRTVHR